LTIRKRPGTAGRDGPEADDCVTMTVWPAMMSVAVRGEDPEFAATVMDATPGPDPEPVNVTQVAPVHEAHAHPDGPVTVIVPPPPIAASVIVTGFTVNVHAPAASVTVNVEPAIVSVADLADVVVLAAAV
jgi:hypothetical protein